MYQEAVEASAKFNKRLFNERRMRMPFIDSQTRVAQTNSMIWMNDSHRTNNFEDRQRGFIYSYQTKKWYKPRRHLFETNDQLNRNNQQSSATLSSMHSINSNEPNGSTHNLHTSNTNGTLHASNSMNTVTFTNENSNSMDSSTFQANRLVNNTSSLAQVSSSATMPVDDYHMDEWQLNTHNIEDSFDNEPNNDNDDSDQDDYEDSKRKGKKKVSHFVFFEQF